MARRAMISCAPRLHGLHRRFDSVFGVLGYVRDTFRGNSFPHRITWFLWGLIPLVTLVVQLRAHVGVQAVMTFPTSSPRWRPRRELRRTSRILGDHSVRLGVRRSLPHRHRRLRSDPQGDLAIGLLLTAEFFAALPTVRKSWKAPETETWTSLRRVRELGPHAVDGDALDVPDLRTVVVDHTAERYRGRARPGRLGPRLSRVSTARTQRDPRMCRDRGGACGAGTPQISMASR